MKRLTIWLSVAIVVILALSVLGGCSSNNATTTTTSGATTTAPSGKVVTLRLTQGEPAGDWMAISNQKMADEFNALNLGYKIEVYPGETLTKQPEAMDSVRTGAAEMMDIGWGAIAGTVNTFGATELPFFFNNIDANAAAQQKMLPILDKEFTTKLNQKALNCYNIGALEYIGTKPMQTLADWKGTLVQAISNQVTALVEGLGGSASAIPFPECYSALQKKTIDASLQGVAFMEIGKLYEPAKNVTFGYLIPATHGWTINLDIWNKMPKNVQDKLLELTAKYAKSQTEAAKTLYIDLETKLATQYGCTVYVLPAAERAKWAETMQPYVNSYLNKMGETGKTMKAIADEVNAQYPNK